MKLSMEIRPDGKFTYSFDIADESKGNGEGPISIEMLGLFVDALRRLQELWFQQDKWSTQLEAIRRLVEKEKEGKEPK